MVENQEIEQGRIKDSVDLTNALYSRVDPVKEGPLLVGAPHKWSGVTALDLEAILKDSKNSQRLISLVEDVIKVPEDATQTILERKKKDQQILSKIYGLEDGKQRTLEEVKKEFGVTRERIRHLRNDALQRIRNQGQNPLKDFFDQKAITKPCE